MLREDSPKKLIEYVTEIMDDLKNNYPIFNEDDYSERQDEAIYEYWKDLNTPGRLHYCQEAHVSIFASRRKNELPHEVYDCLYESGSFY